jgi:2-polyprenyl-3-methyl-5-hydroxy-6-metoxy-1,4-benzoquinol methylase
MNNLDGDDQQDNMKSRDASRISVGSQIPSSKSAQVSAQTYDSNIPVIGGTAPRHAARTAQKLATFALGHIGDMRCEADTKRYLDVGCGNGFITEYIASEFDEVVGIDMERERLEDFRAHTRANPRYRVMEMSAAKMEFPNDSFSFITSFEVLEHVANLEKSVQEIARVCRRGGVLIISVPQVWFPFENHGVRLGQATYERKIPLLPYIRPLHRKYSLARVFSSTQLDDLFLSQGMELLGTAYVSPQFERAAANKNSWESKIKFLRSILERCETIPILRVLTGVSMLKAYRKPL